MLATHRRTACTNAEIAAELVLGEGTVKTHVNHVFAKLQLRDRAAAVVFAFDSGLVRPGARLTPLLRRLAADGCAARICRTSLSMRACACAILTRSPDLATDW